MLVCDIEPNGSAPWELLRKFGGKFNLFQKIKMGGVGSPKIVYQSGLPEIDEFIEETAGSDIPYLNFEYLKNGVLARVNKTQYLKGILISYDEIEAIKMKTFKKVVPDENNELVFHKFDLGGGELEIHTSSHQTLICQVTTQAYSGLIKFFQSNKSVRGKFDARIIT